MTSNSSVPLIAAATNILSLPQLAAAFSVVVNADWRDTIQFQWAPGTANAGQPIDLTGIDFFSQVRPADDLDSILLDMSTKNGLLVTNNALGTLSMAVPRDGASPSAMSSLSPGTLPIMDIVAIADGAIVNLMQVSGPAVVTVARGITSFAT